MLVSTFFVLNATLRYYFLVLKIFDYFMTCTEMNYNYAAFPPPLNLGSFKSPKCQEFILDIGILF